MVDAKREWNWELIAILIINFEVAGIAGQAIYKTVKWCVFWLSHTYL